MELQLFSGWTTLDRFSKDFALTFPSTKAWITSLTRIIHLYFPPFFKFITNILLQATFLLIFGTPMSNLPTILFSTFNMISKIMFAKMISSFQTHFDPVVGIVDGRSRSIYSDFNSSLYLIKFKKSINMTFLWQKYEPHCLKTYQRCINIILVGNQHFPWKNI